MLLKIRHSLEEWATGVFVRLPFTDWDVTVMADIRDFCRRQPAVMELVRHMADW
jgi:hypothetical protein